MTGAGVVAKLNWMRVSVIILNPLPNSIRRVS
jgi:hypothetical protein